MENKAVKVALTQASEKYYVRAFSFSHLRYWLLGNCKPGSRLAACFEWLFEKEIAKSQPEPQLDVVLCV